MAEYLANRQQIRALVVDDSSFFRARVIRILNADPELSVIGFAADGREALEKARVLNPDIITMDVEMPVMDGIAAVREIMRWRPVPILMLSAHTRAGAEATLSALDAGAVDFVTKQSFTLQSGSDDAALRLVSRIKLLSRRRLRGAPGRDGSTTAAPRLTPVRPIGAGRAGVSLTHKRIVVIGASTGGPALLSALIPALSAKFPCPVLVVQHMPGTFTGCFAARLDRQAAVPVTEAVPGEILQNGHVYIAPGGRQTTIVTDRGNPKFVVSEADANQLYKPCIDLTFASVASVYRDSALGIVLTGMGSDGCDGSRSLKQHGAEVWAQDEATSAVFGMPMAVIRAGLADRVLGADELRSQLAGTD